MKEEKREEKVLLTSELYEEILLGSKTEIVRLKGLQGNFIQNIKEKQKALKELKKELMKLKNTITFTKRALNNDKKNLKRTNNNLTIQKNKIIELNNNYTNNGEQYIVLEDFVSEKQKIK